MPVIMFAPGMLSSPRGSPGMGMPGWIIMKAHSEVNRQYVSISRSTNLACCSKRCLCNMGTVAYILLKKKSMHVVIMSPVNSPGVGASVGGKPGVYPFSRPCTLLLNVLCRCVSLNSLITFALDPFGPFF